MIRAIFCVCVVLVIALNGWQQPASAGELDVYVQMASFCEADGCTKEDFYPLIDPTTGQVIDDVYTFLPSDGACIDFDDDAPGDDITIRITTAPGNNTLRTSSPSSSIPTRNICQALVSLSGYPDELVPTEGCNLEPCGVDDLVHSAIQLSSMSFQGEVPAELILVGWTGGTIVIMRPGSIVLGEAIEHYVLYYSNAA